MSNHFPKNFYFGAATSSHQVEGGNLNDWTEWEKENADRLAQESKKYPRENYISGKTTDHYNLFEKDFDLAKQISLNAYRFSIEWSRIEPEEEKFDEKEIEHFRNVIRALKKRGIEPFVTLWHWTLPLWLRDKGGTQSKDFPKYFSRYAEKMVQALGDDVQFWITLNEPEIYSLNSYYRGIWAPEKKGIFNYRRNIKNLIQSHKNAYEALKKINSQLQVGMACNLSYFESDGGFVNNLLTFFAETFWNHYVLKQTADKMDFIGLNYYFHNHIDWGFNKNKNEIVSDLGWELYPHGIAPVIRELKRYGKPLYITENGLADAEDKNRGWFLEETLKAVREEMLNGADVRGYFHWSLLDNFEWDKGFWPRFGLIEVNYKTMERKVRPSAKLYKTIIEKGLI